MGIGRKVSEGASERVSEGDVNLLLLNSLIILNLIPLSFPRRRKSKQVGLVWIPACAGMTATVRSAYFQRSIRG